MERLQDAAVDRLASFKQAIITAFYNMINMEIARKTRSPTLIEIAKLLTPSIESIFEDHRNATLYISSNDTFDFFLL